MLRSKTLSSGCKVMNSLIAKLLGKIKTILNTVFSLAILLSNISWWQNLLLEEIFEELTGKIN